MRRTRFKYLPLLALAAAAACGDAGSLQNTITGPAPTPRFASVGGMSGAVFTTDVGCSGTNVNIFGAKSDVYLDGGPAHPGAAGLPDGYYYVQVTEPDGTLLGTSVGAASPTPVHVTSGEFDTCYQLSAILIKASDGSAGFDDTSNGGGEYKVWVSQDATFPGSGSKTDNFKVEPGGSEIEQQATLDVIKFYDANANGQNDDGQLITGWKFHINDGIDWIRYTPISLVVDPDQYFVHEFDPIQSNWMHTTPVDVSLTLAGGQTGTAEFGNLCLGAGGGLTLGFWSNKNGQKIYTGDEAATNAFLSALNLVNASGSAFNPTAYSQFRTWILSANAVNMAYMLSAQLAAMELNVHFGKVSGSALIYAPGTGVGNALGFATVNAVMTAANNALGADGYTPSGDANRSVQEALKNALDKANNNQNFVQPTPCPFTFAE